MFGRKRVIDVVMGKGEDAHVERFELDPSNKPARIWVYIGLDGSLNASNGDPDKERIAWR